MNNLQKVLLGLAAGILLYYTFHLLVALASLLAFVIVLAILAKAFRSYNTRPGQEPS